MSRRILRPCEVCGRKYDAAYLAELPTGTARLCRRCWQALVGDKLAQPATPDPPPPREVRSGEAPPKKH
jgi:hypothetical protein